MRTTFRWLAGLFVAYLIIAGVWRLAMAVGQRDWAEIVTSVLGLMFVLWVFDTFRPSGPTDLRHRTAKADAPRVT
jgi:hypothetical protein